MHHADGKNFGYDVAVTIHLFTSLKRVLKVSE